ncbi:MULTISPECIES: carbohydrate-binding protein [Marinobacter]|uniref:carbohydrate-binding protein n=1 Tax=Marinobacter TaxID=2742 RepID=UPI000DAD5F9E|nr:MULTISPECIES: carbohydrate-binding protein [Marinobacter]
MMRLALTCLIALLTAVALPVQALERNCTPEDNTWLPSRYYDVGQIVFYDGQWYAAREWQEGQRPDGGGFAWKPLDQAPECDAPQKAVESGANGAAPATSAEGGSSVTGDTPAQTDCKPAPVWTFSEAYSVGQWVTHEGRIYRATRPSNGDMPGVAEPPHWAPVTADCPAGS